MALFIVAEMSSVTRVELIGTIGTDLFPKIRVTARWTAWKVNWDNVCNSPSFVVALVDTNDVEAIVEDGVRESYYMEGTSMSYMTFLSMFKNNPEFRTFFFEDGIISGKSAEVTMKIENYTQFVEVLKQHGSAEELLTFFKNLEEMKWIERCYYTVRRMISKISIDDADDHPIEMRYLLSIKYGFETHLRDSGRGWIIY